MHSLCWQVHVNAYTHTKCHNPTHSVYLGQLSSHNHTINRHSPTWTPSASWGVKIPIRKKCPSSSLLLMISNKTNEPNSTSTANNKGKKRGKLVVFPRQPSFTDRHQNMPKIFKKWFKEMSVSLSLKITSILLYLRQECGEEGEKEKGRYYHGVDLRPWFPLSWCIGQGTYSSVWSYPKPHLCIPIHHLMFFKDTFFNFCSFP